MILIGENIHIISKTVREALEKKDENFVKNLIKIQQNFDAVDLNVGPARGKLDKIFEWLVPLAEDQNISFDSTNIDAISKGLSLVKNPQNCFINSTTNDDEVLEKLSALSLEYACNLIALAMSKSCGISKTADGRLEMVCEMYEKLLGYGIAENKIFFDPLVLPVKADQSQASETLNAIRMISESFENVNIVIGLSNISNGMPKEVRPLINRVYLSMAYGSGLTCVIADAKDSELLRIVKMLENNDAKTEIEQLYIDIVNMMKNFGELEEIKFDKTNPEAQNIIKAAGVLLNKNIYTDNFTQV